MDRLFSGTHLPRATFFSQSEIPRDETSIRCGQVQPAPCPSLFSDSGTLAERSGGGLSRRSATRPSAAPRPCPPEDQLVQSMPDASPTKWHRAHTTWFFEQFLLGEHCRGLQALPSGLRLPVQLLLRHRRPPARAPPARRSHPPRSDEVTAYRAACRCGRGEVAFSGRRRCADATLAPLIEIGVNHEQQHQELMLTDILHAFALNPISPAYDPAWQWPASARERRRDGSLCNEGIHTVGHGDDSFHFDNEQPGAPRAGRPGQDRARPRHQPRMARLHAGRRLRHRDAVADGRFCRRRHRKNGRRRATGARSTANGTS